jgi:hypothetical protein
MGFHCRRKPQWPMIDNNATKRLAKAKGRRASGPALRSPSAVDALIKRGALIRAVQYVVGGQGALKHPRLDKRNRKRCRNRNFGTSPVRMVRGRPHRSIERRWLIT